MKDKIIEYFVDKGIEITIGKHEDSKWSTETFSNECKAVLYTMLDCSGCVCVSNRSDQYV